MSEISDQERRRREKLFHEKGWKLWCAHFKKHIGQPRLPAKLLARFPLDTK